MTGGYRIADQNILIHSVFSDVHRYCAEYRYVGLPAISVEISQTDIDFERKKQENESAREGTRSQLLSDAYLRNARHLPQDRGKNAGV